jgi:hypothetical protein
MKPFSKPHFSGFPLKYDIKLYVVFKAFLISFKLAYRSTSTIQQKLGAKSNRLPATLNFSNAKSCWDIKVIL